MNQNSNNENLNKFAINLCEKAREGNWTPSSVVMTRFGVYYRSYPDERRTTRF